MKRFEFYIINEYTRWNNHGYGYEWYSFINEPYWRDQDMTYWVFYILK